MISHTSDSFHQKQGFVKQAAQVTVLALNSAFFFAYYFQPSFLILPTRSHYFATFIPAAVFLAYCIACIGMMRAKDPLLIDGSAFTNLDPALINRSTKPPSSTEGDQGVTAALLASLTKVRVAQAILQNTLEQTVLMSMVHTIWILCLPRKFLVMQPVAMLAFIIGRILFARGYSQSTRGRALGFALTILSTASLLVMEVLWGSMQIIEYVGIEMVEMLESYWRNTPGFMGTPN
jgi:hypothetical protein